MRMVERRGWERSKTIRGQCEELAAARAVITLEWVVTDSFSHAKTAMAVRGGVVVATVRIPPVGETIVWLAHELQHVGSVAGDHGTVPVTSCNQRTCGC